MDRVVRVLGVDDDPDFGALTATFLEREGDEFVVETAAGAGEGLERLANEEFDCVVSDYDMGGRNGIEFLEAVREDYPDLPFILFTGKGSEEVASDAISAGVTDYLQKEGNSDQFTVLANRIENAVEHARTRQRVERSERRLREIVDALPDPLYVVDADGTYLLANEALAAFHDETVDAVEGSHVSSILDEPGTEHFLADASSVFESGEEQRFSPMEMTDSSGETHVFEPRMLPYDLAETGDRAALGIAVDVTDRVQRERRLNALVERLEALHDATRRLVLVEDRRVVAGILTDAVRRSFEYAHTAVRFRDGDELRPVAVTASARHDVGDRPAYGLDEGLPGKAFQSGETIVVADRRSEAVESPRPVGEDDDEPFAHRSAMYVPIGDHGTMTIGHPDPDVFDDTDRSLARILADNAATVLDRLAGETERRRQNDRLETLIGVVSHDLRNSLNVAQARVDLHSGDGDDEHLAAVVRAHDRMERLIEDMLVLANAGTPTGDLATVDVGAVAMDTWAAVGTETGELDVETTARVRADKSRFRQLFENLFRNAVEHGSTSHRRTEDAVEHDSEHSREDVTVRVGDLPGGFFVADDGPGIPDDERERVFDAGYSTAETGTGFGLAIVAAIAAAHGWEIELTASADGGTRVEFTGVTFD